VSTVLIFLYISLSVSGQILITPSTNLTLLQNSAIQSTGIIENNGTIDVSGILKIKDNLINNNIFTSRNNSKILFNGSSSQDILSSTGPFTFYDAEINNPSGIYLSNDITINNSFVFSDGIVHTHNSSTPETLNTLYFNTGASTPSETSTSYIVGKALMTSRYIGTNSIDFLGCMISSGTDDIGNLTITRINGTEGIITSGSNTSISASWIIESDFSPDNGRSLQFSWLSEFDNAKDPVSAVIWSSESPYSVWEQIGSTQDVSSSDPRTISVNTTHFSKWTISDESSPLPVTLLDFNGIYKNDNVLLSWITASELNTDYFEVQRSYNSIDFDVVGIVDSKGNSITTQFYSLTDYSPVFPANNYLYYMLRNVDYDGEFYLSKIISVTDNEYYNIEIFPNPTNEKLFIKFNDNSYETLNIKIFNNIGLLYMDLKINPHTTGEQMIDLSQLSSGLIFIVIENNGTILKTQPIIKL